MRRESCGTGRRRRTFRRCASWSSSRWAIANSSCRAAVTGSRRGASVECPYAGVGRVDV